MSSPKKQTDAMQYLWELVRMYVESHDEFTHHPKIGAPYKEQPDWTKLHDMMFECHGRLLQFARKHVIKGHLICARCSDKARTIVSKPESEFYPKKRGRRSYWCKQCIKEYNVERAYGGK
jgi:hypothetical protein